MNAATRTLAWEQWRSGVVMSGLIMGAGMVVLLLMRLGIRHAMMDHELMQMTLFVTSIATIGVIAFTLQSNGDVDARFPVWLYRLPVPAKRLAWTVLAARFALALAALLLLYGTYRLTMAQAGVSPDRLLTFTGFVLPLAGFFLMFQAVIWLPGRQALLALLLAVMIVLFLRIDERVLLPALAHPGSALLMAVAGVALAPAAVYADRMGATPFAWVRLPERSRALVAEPDFESPLAAQEWLERRETSRIFVYIVWGVAAMLAVGMSYLVAFILPAQVASGGELYHELGIAHLIVSSVLGGALFTAGLTGAAIGIRRDRQYRSGMATFIHIRPMNVLGFSGSHFRMLGRILFDAFFGAAVILWVGFTLVNHICLLRQGGTDMAFLGTEYMIHLFTLPWHTALEPTSVPHTMALSNNALWLLYIALLLWILLHIGNRYILGAVAIYLLPPAVQLTLFPYAASGEGFVELWLGIATGIIAVGTLGLYLLAVRRTLVSKAPILLILLAGLVVFLAPHSLGAYEPIIQRIGGPWMALTLSVAITLFALLTVVAVPLETHRRRHGGGLI